MIFHRHRWEERERFYAGPKEINLEGLSGSSAKELFERLALGVTTIKLVCRACGEIKVIEVLGKETKN